MLTNNKTLYGIQNGAERHFLIFYNTFIALTSIIGDTIILVGTIKYGAIKLHEIVVLIIQNLAICDLLLTVFRIIPQTAALIVDDWVVGVFMGHAQNLVNYLAGYLTLTLTCSLTTVKLLFVKYPLRTLTWSKNTGYKLCGTLWGLLIASWLPWLLVNMLHVRDTLYFSYRSYLSSYNYFSHLTPPWFTKYASVGFLFGTILPFLVVMVTSLLLLVLARRAASRQRKSVRWQGFWTVFLSAVVFCVSLLPWNVVYASFLLGLLPSVTMLRSTIFLTNLNVSANFFIYVLTEKSFKEFLKNAAISLLLVGRKTQSLQFGQQSAYEISVGIPKDLKNRQEKKGTANSPFCKTHHGTKSDPSKPEGNFRV